KHGSDNASSYDFIQAVSPQIAIISCGEDNRYDFPNGDVIMNLLDAGTEDIRVTWQNGNIHLAVIDGELVDTP
ncbi:MAG: MBL fold metallo-hydrolase, partial [Eubacteriales bacterium]|nr:MBL fold metallo-hydrolase [Eubacteriales bacterium]